MQISDFTASQSVHQLLLLLFNSEIGLESATPSISQHVALSESFEDLKGTILDNLGSTFILRMARGPDLPPAEVEITYNADAMLFKKLYENFNYISNESMLLTEKVYPLIGEMILGNPELKFIVISQLGAHIQAYPAAVGTRIYRDLLKFDLAGLVQQLKTSRDPEPQTRAPAVNVVRHLITR